MSDQSQNSEVEKDHGVLYLGIDLGTSRTSVAASNGERVTLPSFVGYPKDVVSRKLLQKEVLFGDEAIAKRLSLVCYGSNFAKVVAAKIHAGTLAAVVAENLEMLKADSVRVWHGGEGPVKRMTDASDGELQGRVGDEGRGQDC